MTTDAFSADDRHVFEVARAFRDALNADLPLLPTVNAIDILLQAVRHIDLVSSEAAREIEDLIFAVALRVTEAVAPAIASDRLYLGFAAAAGLITSMRDDLHFARLLYTALLVAELKTILFRTEIARRGDPLAHSIALRRAWDTPRNPEQPLQ